MAAADPAPSMQSVRVRSQPAAGTPGVLAGPAGTARPALAWDRYAMDQRVQLLVNVLSRYPLVTGPFQSTSWTMTSLGSRT
jgi:hypothetical protein